MSIVPTLNLFKDSSGSNTYWWLDIILAPDEEYEIDSHGSVPSESNSQGEFHIEINLCDVGAGVTTYPIDLGEIPLDPDDGEIHISMFDQVPVHQGGGIVKAKDATESTRPTP